jgi:ribonuclease P protein component
VRVAFAIPRSVGSAVVRNRIRRRLRAALGELGAPPGTYLVSATPAAASLDYQALRQELGSCLGDLAARG